MYNPKCYFCHEEATEDNYCFNCDNYICKNCDFLLMLGSHKVEDHMADLEWDDE